MKGAVERDRTVRIPGRALDSDAALSNRRPQFRNFTLVAERRLNVAHHRPSRIHVLLWRPLPHSKKRIGKVDGPPPTRNELDITTHVTAIRAAVRVSVRNPRLVQTRECQFTPGLKLHFVDRRHSWRETHDTNDTVQLRKLFEPRVSSDTVYGVASRQQR